MTEVKIVTINTWKCDGDYRRRMPVLAKQLAELKPNIIACQECFKCQEADTLKFLADSLNMYDNFLPGRAKKRLFEGKWTDSVSGLGILSAYSILGYADFTLPLTPGDDDRKAQQVIIGLPGGKNIIVTNTHLTHVRNATAARTIQAEALADFATAAGQKDYHIICGDFNSTINSVEMNSLRSRANAVDCYAAGGGMEPRYSLADFHENNQLVCVDHIFALPLTSENIYPEFINAGVVLNNRDTDTGLYPSDHFGISVTLVIK